MSDQLTPEEEHALQQLSENIAQQLAEGVSREKIVKRLVKKDWNESQATQYVSEIERELQQFQNSPSGRAQMASKYKRHMLYGVLWAGGGTAVTLYTLNAASGGGTYVVAWGAIIFGVVDFFRGLIGYMKYRD
jgi:hypothetical protein